MFLNSARFRVYVLNLGGDYKLMEVCKLKNVTLNLFRDRCGDKSSIARKLYGVK